MTIIQKRSRLRTLRRNGLIPKTRISGVEIAGLTNEAAESLLIEFDPQWPGFTGEAPAPTPELPVDEVETIPTESESAPDPAPALKPATEPSAPDPGAPPATGLDAVLAAAIEPHLKAQGFDREKFDALAAESERLKERIEEIASKASPAPATLEIVKPDGSRKNVGRAHKCFPDLLTIVSAGCHGYLVGPAGSFKTTAGAQVAEALELDFSSISVCQQTTATALLGYMNATGDYVTTEFRKRYENGGLFLLDEIDNGNANIIAVLNSGLSNGEMAFPDGMVKRSPDFRLIATANTFGTGPDAQYVGRCQLDAATLDRFAFLEWPYDEELEREIAGNDEWTDRVIAIRGAVDRLSSRLVVSPRATFEGARLLAAGMDQSTVENLKIWKGTSAEEKTRIQASV